MAQQSYFETLGLSEPPRDRREVKRAYSARLKQTRPEDDPEGFMRLRDAHDLALHILKIEAEDQAREEEEQQAAPPALDYATLVEDVAEGAAADNPTRVADIPPAFERPVEESDTTYSIGPTPSLDAPLPDRAPPPPPPLLDDLQAILTSPPRRNDRDSWNQLFRKARQLPIDDYVDFEDMLLEVMLRHQGFYDHSAPYYDTPELMSKQYDPSITASLFRTMNWDKVGKYDSYKTYQIEWLERRMGLRRPAVADYEGPPDASGPNNTMNWVWPLLFTLFILAQFARFLAS